MLISLSKFIVKNLIAKLRKESVERLPKDNLLENIISFYWHSISV